MIEIRNMKISDAYVLAKDLRESDRLECEALGMTPKEVLRKSFYDSIFRKTTLVDGNVVACFGGTGSALGHVMHPWLLTSPKAEKVYLTLASAYRKQVKAMLLAYPVLENHCDNRYSKSLNLLRLVGFKVEAPEPYGPLKMPFCRFHMEAA